MERKSKADLKDVPEPPLSPETIVVLNRVVECGSWEQFTKYNLPVTDYSELKTAVKEVLFYVNNVKADPVGLVRSKHPRAYEPWSELEDKLLLRMFKDGKTVQEISDKLKRQPSAVRSRLVRLKL